MIACANTTEGFSPELLDRFDFRFKLELPDTEEQKRIMDGIVNGWFREKPDYEGGELRDYLKWIKPYEPEISDEVRERTKEIIQDQINSESEGTSIRQRESIMRVAYTISKLNRRDMEAGDVLSAIDLQDPRFDRNGTLEEWQLPNYKLSES